MNLSPLVPLYEKREPYISVYLDTTRKAAEPAKLIALRWAALRDELVAQQAPQRALHEIESILLSERHAAGHAVFAAGDEIALSERLATPPRSYASFSPLPHVLPYLACRGEQHPHVVAVVDRRGGTIDAVTPGGRQSFEVQVDEGHPIRGELNQSRLQRAAENAWRSNAKKVGTALDEVAKLTEADVVVVAGDPHARTFVMEEISGSVRDRAVESDLGSRAQGADRTPLDREVGRVTGLKSAEQLTSLVTEFHEQLAKGALAVDGVSAVVGALQRKQARTLLLEDHPESKARLWFGPRPEHIAMTAGELRRMGVDTPDEDRADAVLVRALASSGAELTIVPRGSLHADGSIGALLRYADLATSR